MSILFAENRTHFFRPLLGKYRAQVVECLSTFYQRLYGSLADYSRSFTREQVIEVLEEALARSSAFDEDDSDEFSMPVRSGREQAGWVLNLLLEHGWIERHIDEVTLHSTYAFTRYGRLFTQPMVEAAGGRFRTRHRNTRNTRNALQSFAENGEVYDLLDAYEYSERIVSDFSDLISELDERRRQLVRAVEAQQVVQRASDEFFDFMEKRFMPDVAIRLSADSVEKYRDEISDLIQKIRRKRKEFKAAAERELRRSAPELVVSPQQSVLLAILDGIETRMFNASTVMLPALRQALNSFTRRADIIMRQLTYAGGGLQNQLQHALEQIKQATPEQQSGALDAAGETLASLAIRFPDTDAMRLYAPRKPRIVNSAVEENMVTDLDSRKQMFVQTAVDLAFTFNNQRQRDYVVAALSDGETLHSRDLPVSNATELLMAAHIVEVGSVSASEFAFRLTPTGERYTTPYFNAIDEFTIELVRRADDAE